MTVEKHRGETLPPTAIILMGATGDLAQKKLLPALMDLYLFNALPKQFYLLGFSRNKLTNEAYRDFVREKILSTGKQYRSEDLTAFLSNIHYTHGTFEDEKAFSRVKELLETHDERIGMCTSKLFYLAVPPVFYETIFEQIAKVNLEQPCLVGNEWTRILVEKPFGSDLQSSKHLENKLCSLFKEEQIYRIDHYLAKDALQNIIAFRFSNVFFEERWNKDFIEGIYIQVFEKKDVGTRGAFFDGVGALRDVGQNHILQMLTLITMDRPEELEVEALRKARATLLKSLHIPEGEEMTYNTVKGQYEGYTLIEDVAPHSKTETYFALKASLNDPQWEGVPIYFEHGKALSKNAVSITVRFRSSKHCVCNSDAQHDHPGFITFEISPEQRIRIRFWVRKPGLKYELEQEELVFDKRLNGGANAMSFDAYEEVLFNALSGDQTLFVSGQEQEAAWKYITAILRHWSETEPIPYQVESDGPDSKLKEEIKTLFN